MLAQLYRLMTTISDSQYSALLVVCVYAIRSRKLLHCTQISLRTMTLDDATVRVQTRARTLQRCVLHSYKHTLHAAQLMLCSICEQALQHCKTLSALIPWSSAILVLVNYNLIDYNLYSNR
jgi:hypothetical protein